jgi:hypothetical protein
MRSDSIRSQYCSKVFKLGLWLLVIQLCLGLAIVNLLSDASVHPSLLDSLPISADAKSSPAVLLGRRSLTNAEQNIHIVGWVLCLGTIVNIGFSLALLTGSLLEKRRAAADALSKGS